MPAKSITTLLQDIRLVNEMGHQVMERARRQVLAVGDGVTEEVKYGGILFSRGVPFCGLFCYTSHVSLEFSHGAALPDEQGLLEGKGKQRRHLKLQSLNDLESKHVEHYVALAYSAAGG
ncbi:DUF1801 domain-containing protein [Aquabacterium sp. A7-Y]|uniref:DUF1801 domain-containing protein n=1 Tax=Aquabacterium sp. A7-Y TaxID=1349605 RepID=UPI00223E8CCE|nr:DUF1801 domain-containing protein [Aquabacterium sp. A7-Y]MCW7538023.1 DUF1801 domain-containing protein [Aquabacterium sp. A7-Y]